MSKTQRLKNVLDQAKEKEKKYDWVKAAEHYEQALRAVGKRDFLRLGQVQERVGYAFYRAAMQAENQEEFRDRMRRAVANYEKAKEFYEHLGESVKMARMLRCDAMIAYVGYWLSSDVPEKKSLLDECWRLAKESLKAFEESGEPCEYGKTYSQLSNSAVFIFTFESDFESRGKVMGEVVESGERAIKFLSDCNDPSELARVYAKTVVCLGVFGYYFQDVDERDKYREKGLDYWAKAKELSEEAAMTEFVYPVFGGQPFFGVEGTDEAFANYEKALEYGKKMKDRLVVGCALDWLTYHTAWKIQATEDPDEKTRLIEREAQYAEEANRQFSIISFVSPRGDTAWLGGTDVEHWMRLSSLDTDLKKKRDLLEKALQAVPSVVKRGEESGYPEILMYLHNGRAVLRLQQAKFETNLEEKRKLLEEALFYCNESIKITEQLEPFLYWNRGISRNMLSNIKSELADLAKEPETKKTLLQEAVTNKENAIELLIKELTFFVRKGSATSLFATVGSQQYGYGSLLVRLYKLTNNKELLRKTAKAYEYATESYRKLNLVTRIAESHWKKAQVYNTLGEHLTASQNFDIATNNYKSASEKIPQLKDFYQDYAFYMQAWSEIEKARHHHEKQEYGLAEEHFEKAAKLHKTLKKWTYMAPNYAAWAQLDHAEELSRKENGEEAIQAFERAATLFEETRKSLQNELVKIEDSEEKQMATTMAKTTDMRRLYCMARIAVEEAKILDKKGDHYSSSEKYNSAAETFGRIAQAVESERDRKEFDLITTLSHAWARMTRAEAEASPALYAEASQLFEEAKDLSPNEKTKMLTLGHSRFCRALEAGTKFVDTRDRTMHVAATKCLESAASYYVKAGFQSASEYAKATDLLFDAYVHMDDAKEEKDPEKKAKLYAIAEKVLQTSAGSFMKAEHPEKREQVLRLLEKVKEERELAISITEVLHAPSIISTTKAFTTPTPNHEEAVGSERFEHADIQANLLLRVKELKVGENLNLRIELVNAGKAPALLIKVDEIIPEGFEIREVPEIYTVEDRYLNMKGRRLNPLKTEDVKMVVKPRSKGTFIMKPRILYLDETGKYKSQEPEPVTITVKELGIKGWIKGEK